MIMSIFGLIVFIIIVAALMFTPKNLFGSGGIKDLLIKVLAAKELADIALHNNKKNVPDMAKDAFSKVTGHGDDEN